MIDFLQQQDRIKNYVTYNYPKILEELNLPDVGAYISDFIDLDKYTKSTQLFFDFGDYQFSNLSNESNTQEITAHIYLTFKNKKSTELHELMMKYAACFYELVERSNQSFDGVVDFVRVAGVRFYDAAEADLNIKVADITLTIVTEQ